MFVSPKKHFLKEVGPAEEGHRLQGRVSFSGTCGCHTAQQPRVLKHPWTLAGRASAPLLECVGSRGPLFLGVSTLTFFFLLGGVRVTRILTTQQQRSYFHTRSHPQVPGLCSHLVTEGIQVNLKHQDFTENKRGKAQQQCQPWFVPCTDSNQLHTHWLTAETLSPYPVCPFWTAQESRRTHPGTAHFYIMQTALTF